MNSQKGQPVASASETLPVVEMREGLSDLFAMHHRRVLMAAYRITGSMADAEDVAQSIFLRLAAGTEFAVSNAGSYLYRAAINGALDLYDTPVSNRSRILRENEWSHLDS